MDISLLDPTVLSFLLGLGFIVPLFVYTRGGGGGVTISGGTANRLARISNSTTLINSLLSDDGTNVTLASGQLLMPDGTASLPAFAFSGNPDTGFIHSGSVIGVVLNTNPSVVFDGQSVRIGVNGNFQFSSDTNALTGAADLVLTREAAARLQQGADSADPIAQTIKGPDGSGTDISGADFTVAPGRGTGTGIGGRFRIATAPAGGASGSTQNALVDRFVIDSAGLGSMTALQISSLTGAAGYRGIATMNSGTTVVSVAATAAISGAVVLTQILQYVGDVSSQAGFSTGVQSVRAGAFEIVAIGSRAPIDNAPIAWFVLR